MSTDHPRPKPFSAIREFHLRTGSPWQRHLRYWRAVCHHEFPHPGTRCTLYAGMLVLAALVFDVLDGRIARWRQKTSAMGRELDSLADVISFGVAPAVLGYACGMQGLYDRILLAYFVACGVSRLARYNVTAEAFAQETGKVTYFEGTPIPTSTVLVLLLMAAAQTNAVGDSLWFGSWWIGGHMLHPLTLLFGVSGSLMISRIRIPKL